MSQALSILLNNDKYLKIFKILPAGVNRYISLNVASDLGGVHVGGVLEVGSKTMVLADEGVEDLSEVNIGVLITSVDAAVLVVEFNCASNGLGQGELRGLGDNLVELVPFLFSDVLGDQGVLGLDFGERSHGPVTKSQFFQILIDHNQ